MLKNKQYNAKVVSLVLLFLPAVCGFVFFNCFAVEKFSYDAKGKRNPFIPLVTSDGKILNLDSESSGSKGLALEGIIYDKNGISYAILNGSIVKIGDFVGDVQVLKVEKNKIILIKDGQTSEVKLKEEEEK